MTSVEQATFRLYFQNIKGCHLQRTAADLTYYLDAIRSKAISLFGWAKRNTNWRNTVTMEEFREKAGRTFEVSKCAFSTSEVPSHSNYNPGGTAMTITGKWCGRATTEAGMDPSGMGRWSFMTLQGKNSIEILVITACRVSQASMPQHGDRTSYHQEYMIMSRNGETSPNPRRQFIIDIITFIQTHQHHGKEILLMIDTIEELGKKSQEIVSILQECSLYNLLAELHPNLHPPVIYDRGSSTIDYLW